MRKAHESTSLIEPGRSFQNKRGSTTITKPSVKGVVGRGECALGEFGVLIRATPAVNPVARGLKYGRPAHLNPGRNRRRD